jgi:hypothetical protein
LIKQDPVGQVGQAVKMGEVSNPCLGLSGACNISRNAANILALAALCPDPPARQFPPAFFPTDFDRNMNIPKGFPRSQALSKLIALR